mmetsp:Transcript_20171/g.77217  ORF Transcript_20171/g.77217 Transcript_20171/m.77217 type:complete len:558 (-) Transcript_20171:54-1727(-)
MRWAQAALAFAVLAVLACSCAAVDWEGTWGDSCDDDSCYGGQLNTCTSGNTLYGFYSDIGFVFGETKGNDVDGVWFEAGFEEDNYGSFHWEVAGDDDDDFPGFTGTWNTGSRTCIKRSWAAPLLSDNEPSQAACAAIADDDDDGMSGTWVSEGGEVLDLCLWQQKPYFYGSSSVGNSTEETFYTGVSHLDFKVAQASTFSSGGQGIALMVRINDDRLLVTRWAVETTAEARDRFGEPGLHTTEIFDRVAGDGNDDDDEACARGSEFVQGWLGVFSDPRHGQGRLAVCNVGGTRVQGIFSELGWLDGTVDPSDPSLFEGTWQQAGDDDDDKGTFRLRLDALGISYSGAYTRGDDDDDTIYRWEGTRLSAQEASASQQCWTTTGSSPGASVGGIWKYGSTGNDVFDICVSDEGGTQVSYAYNGGSVRGYGLGKVSDDLQSMRLHWKEEEAEGIAIYRLLDDNTLLESLWALETDADDIDIRFCDDDQLNYQYWGLHAVNRISRISDSMNADRCDRYDGLSSIEPSRSSYERISSSPPDSAAAALALSLLSVALAALFLL